MRNMTPLLTILWLRLSLHSLRILGARSDITKRSDNVPLVLDFQDSQRQTSLPSRVQDLPLSGPTFWVRVKSIYRLCVATFMFELGRVAASSRRCAQFKDTLGSNDAWSGARRGCFAHVHCIR